MSPIDIQIKIFDRSITFYNPGSLYGDLTIEQLKKDNYQAHTRNKLIAEAFYLAGDIEKYGSGFLRIRDEIKTYSTMRFDFENAPNGFMAHFVYDVQKTKLDNNSYFVIQPTENFTENFTENQRHIIGLIRKNPTITIDQLAVKINITRRAVINNTNKLKKKGLIKRIGPAKGGYWEVLKK